MLVETFIIGLITFLLQVVVLAATFTVILLVFDWFSSEHRHCSYEPVYRFPAVPYLSTQHLLFFVPTHALAPPATWSDS